MPYPTYSYGPHSYPTPTEFSTTPTTIIIITKVAIFTKHHQQHPSYTNHCSRTTGQRTPNYLTTTTSTIANVNPQRSINRNLQTHSHQTHLTTTIAIAIIYFILVMIFFYSDQENTPGNYPSSYLS